MIDTKTIPITLARLMRYSYGGMLLMTIVAVINPIAITPSIDALGSILAPLAALGLGIGIYVVHRYVIGELILFPSVDVLHRALDRRARRTGRLSSSAIGYLQALGVDGSNARAAYTAVRRYLFDSATRENLDLSHSEIHVLYMTMEQAFVAAIYLLASESGRGWIVFALLFGLTALSAVIADIRQHQLESHMLRVLERNQGVTKYLLDVGYLQDPTSKGELIGLTDG